MSLFMFFCPVLEIKHLRYHRWNQVKGANRADSDGESMTMEVLIWIVLPT